MTFYFFLATYEARCKMDLEEVWLLFPFYKKLINVMFSVDYYHFFRGYRERNLPREQINRGIGKASYKMLPLWG